MLVYTKPSYDREATEEERCEAMLLGGRLHKFNVIKSYIDKWGFTPNGWSNSIAADEFGVYETPREALDAHIKRNTI